MLLEPPLGEAQGQALLRSRHDDPWKRSRTPPTVQEHGDSENDGEPQSGLLVDLRQLPERSPRELPAVRLDERGEKTLVVQGEARELRVRHDIGSMPLVAAIGDGEADLVQPRGPGEELPVLGLAQAPAVPELLQPGERRPLDPVGLGGIDPVLLDEALDGTLPRVLVPCPADEVVEDSFAEGTRRWLHGLDAESVDDAPQDRDPAGEDRGAFGGEARERELRDPTRLHHRPLELFQRLPLDARAESTVSNNVGDDDDRSRGAVGLVPAQVLEPVLDGLKLDPGGGLGRFHVLGRDHPVGKEVLGVRDASHEEARRPQGVETLTDDAFGRAAADVHHQPTFPREGKGVRDAEVDEPRLLLSGDDLDVMSQGRRRFSQHGAGALHLPEGVGPHRPHLFGRDVAKPLPEFEERLHGALEDLVAQRLIFLEPGRETDSLAEAIDLVHFVVHEPRNLHVKTVRAEIDGGEDVRATLVWHEDLKG